MFINYKKRCSLYVSKLLLCLALFFTAVANAAPECQLADSDPDGDGWGWEDFGSGHTSCRVTANTPGQDPDPDPTGDFEVVRQQNTNHHYLLKDSLRHYLGRTSSSCVSSVRSRLGSQVNDRNWSYIGNYPNASSSARITCNTFLSSLSSGPDIPDDGNVITDIIMIAGQSNATGQNSISSAGGYDGSNDNVMVWDPSDDNTGVWIKAELCSQTWYLSGYGNGTQNYPSRPGTTLCQNHPAFQIAREIVADDPGRKVGFIVTGLPNTKLAPAWSNNGIGRQEINNVASAAILQAGRDGVAASNRYVKYIVWAQGESDRNDSGNGNTYYNNFRNLVNHWEQQSWFQSPNGDTGKVVAQYIKPSWRNCRGSGRNPGNSIGNPVTSSNELSDNNVNRAINTAYNNSVIVDRVTTNTACTIDGTHYNTRTMKKLGERHSDIFRSHF